MLHHVEVSDDGTWVFQERGFDGKLRTFLELTITEIVTQHPDEQPSCDVRIQAHNVPGYEPPVESASLRVYF